MEVLYAVVYCTAILYIYRERGIARVTERGQNTVAEEGGGRREERGREGGSRGRAESVHSIVKLA